MTARSSLAFRERPCACPAMQRRKQPPALCGDEVLGISKVHWRATEARLAVQMRERGVQAVLTTHATLCSPLAPALKNASSHNASELPCMESLSTIMQSHASSHASNSNDMSMVSLHGCLCLSKVVGWSSNLRLLKFVDMTFVLNSPFSITSV